jgi:hypothetical protein
MDSFKPGTMRKGMELFGKQLGQEFVTEFSVK